MKTSKMAFVIMLALTMLLGSSLAVGAQGGIGGTWNSGFQIQNIGDGEASVTIEFYDDTGTLIHTDSKTIPVGGNVNVYPPGDYTDTELPSGKYSVVLSSSQPIAAVANNVNIGSQIGDSYLGSEAGSQTVYAPLIYRHHSSYTSIVYAQNATGSSQDITIDLYRVGESTAAVSQTYTAVPGYATQEIDFEDFTAFGDTYGSAVISGEDGDIAVVVVANKQPSADPAQILHTEYRGLSPSLAGKKFFTPLIFKNHSSWQTGIMVQNIESLTTTVAITYTASPDSSAAPLVRSGSITLGPDASGVFYLPDPAQDGLDGAALPDGFYGGAELFSDTTDVLAIANNVKYASGYSVGSSYEAFSPSTATSSIAAPLVFRAHAQYETGIQVQNVGNGSTDITLTITKSPSSSPTGGNGPWTLQALGVGPGEVATFYLPGTTELGGVSGLYGGAVITSTNDVPIVAVVNSTRYAAGQSANYIGINY